MPPPFGGGPFPFGGGLPPLPPIGGISAAAFPVCAVDVPAKQPMMYGNASVA